MAGIGIDCTDRLRKDEELKRSREQLQLLTGYATRKLEEQRLALARDVHDELGGMLTALKMDVARVMRRVDSAELNEMTRGLMQLTQDTIDAVKRIAEELRPSALDHLELPVAITRDLDAFTRRSGIAHRVEMNGVSALRLSPERTTAVYRIFHEALTNVARHARARLVRATLSLREDVLVVEVQDDGCGFDVCAARDRSLGLLHMRERARGVGGTLSIESTPNAGTRLVLATPVL